MAQGKKSFIAYSDWKDMFDELPNEDAGILIKHIFAYVNDENPVSDSLLIRALFANIKTTLKRDLQKWDNQIKQRSEAGKISAKKRLLTKNNDRTTTVKKQQRKTTVNVNDTVNVNVNEKKEIKKMPGKPADFIDKIVNCFIEEHGDYEIITPGKEREMAGKILHIYKKKYPDANSEEILTGLRSYFKMCINIKDSWLRNNMSLSIIVSKFNEINKILKNGTNKNDGATKEQLAELIARTEGTNK